MKSKLSLGELIRRFYLEIVKGRTRVKVVESKSIDNEIKPIFIIGVYRSGTTLLRYIIDSHSQICCPPESNILCKFSSLVNDEKSSDGFSGMGFERDHVVNRINEFIRYFFENYSLAKEKPRWADKSTSNVNCLEFISEVFPNACYIMIYRHCFDQVESFTKGGKKADEAIKPYLKEDEDIRLAGTRYWTDKVKDMLNFEKEHKGNCFHLRYEDLCEKPQILLPQMFEFLGENWEEQVLRFYDHEHDKGPEHGRTIGTSGFKVSKDNYLYWPSQILSKCEKISGYLLSDLGYDIEVRK